MRGSLLRLHLREELIGIGTGVGHRLAAYGEPWTRSLPVAAEGRHRRALLGRAVEGEVQRDHIDPRFAQDSELRPFAFLSTRAAHRIHRHAPHLGDA